MKNLKYISACIFCGVFLIFCLSNGNVYAKSTKSNVEKIKVFVSILPQAYFVERVGGDRVDVSVMVDPGQSPATYEPMPKQMVKLGKAKLFFRIGVPFEDVWMDRIGKTNPKMKVIDTRRGIKLLPMKTHHLKAPKQHAGHQQGGLKDPHIWTSLRLVKIQAQNICDALINCDPASKDYYQNNLRTFIDDLNNLDAEIIKNLKDIRVRKFMVFHPAWGYFARDYGLDQIPIEIGGKDPGARELANLIEEAKNDGIKIIFVQKQFSEKSAEAIAAAIGGRIIQIDPLAKDYLNNMKMIAETFRLIEVMR
ncbi:MAG: zinc ABC transporter substrate-binding protein [Desulfobacterales bacterium]|uniref:Zinc ABC transporter substrate-binding protein n=1 Tax=Candidatus Desulfaltia bathyphila TaxID=2841697 RepID=A0A8J6N346_9BACT|nr:zinc ABC transporter substrate-binding protein [Candidatus Desulfaltia bathyphila]MBL7195834.1 zinc ABC transporter substrate-binding protein [Desulfobacterales bacterium]MBL7207641.1 zinc ABC transporter substrate-binding protein [Desulfobacterales bacterium]